MAIICSKEITLAYPTITRPYWPIRVGYFIKLTRISKRNASISLHSLLENLTRWVNFLTTQHSKNKFSLHSLLENLEFTFFIVTFAEH